MHKVIAESKTFSKILVAVDELRTSTASTNKAIDYAVNMAQDYDAQLIILYVIRADPRVHSTNYRMRPMVTSWICIIRRKSFIF
jgi:nucleotide-binding universal stress UspA family protein